MTQQNGKCIKTYNIMDVEAEREIYNLLKNYDWPSIERRLYNLDQKINDFGIRLDLQFAQSCITMDESYRSILTKAVINKIGVANPNSDMQIKKWILEQTGETVESLAKPAMPKVIEQFKGNKLVSYILKARNQLSKSSIKKYTSMLNCAGTRLKGKRFISILWSQPNWSLGRQTNSITKSSAKSH